MNNHNPSNEHQHECIHKHGINLIHVVAKLPLLLLAASSFRSKKTRNLCVPDRLCCFCVCVGSFCVLPCLFSVESSTFWLSNEIEKMGTEYKVSMYSTESPMFTLQSKVISSWANSMEAFR